MIPYGHQTSFQKVKLTSSFEKALAKYCGAKYAIAVSNGTAALHLAYVAAGLKKDDEVITTPNTFAATTNMLLVVGAKPVFTDIRLDTYSIDQNKIEKLITKKTKAIVPVHFSGQPVDLSAIKKIAKKHKLLVIEDACHALGARYGKTKIGNGHDSDLTVFSFHPVKSITTGEGGAVLTSNKKLYDRLVLLRNHGIYKDKKGKNVMIELGFNYRLDEMSAALGLSQLKKINDLIKKRRQVVGWYKKELSKVKDVILPQEVKGNYSSWHLFVIRLADTRKRDHLVTFLKQNGIGVNFHYPAVYSHPYYKKIGYKNFKLKNEEVYQHSCITLPCYPQLKPKEVSYISSKIKEFFN